MIFFNTYKKEVSALLLVAFFYGFAFEAVAAVTKPMPVHLLKSTPVYTQPSEDLTSDLNDLIPESESMTFVEPVLNQGEDSEKTEILKEETVALETGFSSVLYPADMMSGVIGGSNQSAFDAPEDNLFKIIINEDIDEGANYTLTYEVYGIGNASGVTKSINTNTSKGGFFIDKKGDWTRVTEFVSPKSLRQGTNTILFTSDLKTDLGYHIRNLQIEKNTEDRSDLIYINDVVKNIEDNKIYVQGILKKSDSDVQLFVGDKELSISETDFEGVVSVDVHKEKELFIELRKGAKIIERKSVAVPKITTASHVKTIDSAFERSNYAVAHKQEEHFALENIAITVPEQSYSEDFTLSIQELRTSDYAPTGMALRNVTKNNAAYRFLPDGITFEKEVEMKIKYDLNALPKGYSPKDIQVFYFDTAVKQWTKVKVIDILEDSQEVVATSNHFTDYLAGVIQEPESPETTAFTPTTVSGIQAANPTENIPMVSVPQINDKGDAVLNFPLILPPAREGMVPDLSVNYNSSADEGDFGLGWSLSVPVISVDTRWGVPVYDTGKETESYLFNGEELLLVKPDKTLYVPHKDVAIARVSNAVFKKAQHDPSVVITRQGTSPANYTWKVEDSKSGWTYTYNIYSKGKWYLKTVDDVFKNSMEYFYNQNASGDYQLQKINYNKSVHLDNYLNVLTVEIYRKNTIDVPSTARKDVRMNNRYGVESQSIQLIDRIIVRTEPKADYASPPADKGKSTGDVYNEYKFVYREGKFGRSLLQKIVNTNSNNTLHFPDVPVAPPSVQEYVFEYHDDIGGGSLFESTARKIPGYKDYETDYDKFGVYISALGGAEGKSTTFGGGGSFGVVTPIFLDSWLPFSRSATVGGNFGGSSSNSETKVMMIDIDGDGLPDKVFKGDNKFYYRKNLGGTFSYDVYSIKKLPNLSYSKTRGSEKSFAVNILFGSFNKTFSESSSTTYTYTADVNGDGLLDVVDNERVYFGYIDPQTKEPAFSLDSSITPAIVLKEDDVAPILNGIPEIGLTNGPMDLVMVWRAPKDGSVSVTGTIAKQHVTLNNGVKFSIERLHESNMGTASFVLGPNLMLSSSESHSHTLTVVKGDLLFFRVHTNQIPLEELGVTWNPKVTYSGPNLDPVMSSSRHSSSYKESFIVGANYEHIFKKKGQYRLEWTPFSLNDKDRITIKVSHFKKNTDEGGNIPAVGNNMVIYEKTSGIETTTSFPSPNQLINMSAVTSTPSNFQYMKVEVLSDSEIDWKSIDTKFRPKLVSMDDENEDLYLTPYYSNYSRVHIANPPLTFTSSGVKFTVTMNNNFTLPACTQEVCQDRYIYALAKYNNGSLVSLVNINSGDPVGYFKFRFKISANGAVIQRQRLNQNYVYVNVGTTDSFTATSYPGSNFYFEYYSPEYSLAKKLDTYQNTGSNYLVRIAGPTPYSNHTTGVDSGGRVKASIYSSENTSAWGAMYRNWGQFAYKGADVGGPYKAIVGEHINLFGAPRTTANGETVEDVVTDPNLSLDDVEANFDQLENLAGNVSEYFGVLMPEKERNRWQSHEHLYVSETKISPYIRFLTDDIPELMPPTLPVHEFGAYGINKHSYFKNNSTNKSVGFLMVNAGTTKTEGSSDLLNEFMDINGDGFPDIVGKKIQLTAKRGGLSSRIIDANFNSSTSIEGSGSMLGGSSPQIKGSAPLSGDSKFNISVGNQGSGSLNGSSFNTTNKTTRFYVDINGDGLIDIAQSDGKVFLNYGGIFTLSNLWSSLPLQETKTSTKGISAGYGFSGLSNLDISVGLSISGSTSKDETTYMDLNGDGLPEKIIDGSKYFINLGTRFDSGGKTLPGVQSQKSIEAGINGNGTYCYYFPVPIIFTGPKFCVSLGGSDGRSISSEEGRYMDFDGDGYTDYVVSTKNESADVYYSRIKRTNLLKTVRQSTGARIDLDYDTKNPIDKSVIGSTYKMPFKKWALTKVAVYDGFVGDGESMTRYQYEYFNGYKDRKERSFLGFGMTKAHLMDKDGWAYRTDVKEYFLNEMTENQQYRPGTSSDLKQYLYKKGLLKKSSTFDRTKRLMNETVYGYKFYDSSKILGDLNTTTTSNAEVTVFTEKLSVLPLVTNVQSKVVNFDEDTENSSFTFVTEQKFNLYDKKGNVKKYQDLDRGLTVDIDYNLGIKTLPISHRISKTVGNAQLRLTKVGLTANGMKYAFTEKYFTNTEAVLTKYEYNQLGSLVKTTLDGGFVYKFDYDEGMYGTISQNEYNGNYSRVVPSRITDPFGNVSEFLNNGFGQPVIVKDVYKVEVNYKYDHFNRLLEFKGPYEADWTIRNKFVSNRIAISQHNLGNGNILHTSMINDGLGRTLQVKKELMPEYGALCANDSIPKYRLAVSGKTFYDEFGRSVENYLSDEEIICPPVSSGVTLEAILREYYETPTTAEKKIGRKYDNKDRVIEELVYGTNALTKNKYSFGPDNNGVTAFTHEVILPEGNKTVTYTNKLGQTSSQKQVDGNESLWTSYGFDLLGQPTEIRNALDHYYTYRYDLLGRVTDKYSSAEKDTRLEYDNLGQLTRKRDANGNEVNYIYEFNRLVKIANSSIHTIFEYEPEGRLSKMKDNSGTHNFKYGKLGEVVEESKMVNDQNGGSHYFTTRYKYDSWGRILEMVYPDQEHVFYNYNKLGQLKEIVNSDEFYYLKDVKYNYFDQPYYVKYGNDVEMKQEFDLTERLRAAQLAAPDPLDTLNMNVFSRNVYGYDRNNNISNVLNNFSQHENIIIGGTSKKTFEYDAYNRLKEAQGQWDGLLEKHNYTLKMKYRKDHSILRKDQIHTIQDIAGGVTEKSENYLDRGYKYEDESLPRLTEIAGDNFGQFFKYNENGTISSIYNTGSFISTMFKDRNFTWDANNNITEIIDNDGSISNQYVYDGKGERVVKRVQGGNNIVINGNDPENGLYGADEVLYPSGNLVYSDKVYTKHYYSNGKRLASRIGDSYDVDYFTKENLNQTYVSPHLGEEPMQANSQNSGIQTFGIGAPVPGPVLPISKVSLQICENQINILLNVLYNTPEKTDCRNAILAIIEKHKKYNKVCIQYTTDFVTGVKSCIRYIHVASEDHYCLALEEINTLGCIERTEDGQIIDPETGYIYDPLTGLPHDPETGLPIDLGTGGGSAGNQLELDCYNKFLNFIEYYKDKEEKPEEYDELVQYLSCLNNDCNTCLDLPFTKIDDQKRCSVDFCDLNIPDIIEEEEEEEVLPEFPDIDLGTGVDDTWVDEEPEHTEIEDDVIEEQKPVWWYHSDHLGSSSYITDILGKPVQYYEYLPFGEIMVQQSTNNIFENVYKFNGKELDEQTGYYYYGARYYDPGASIFLSVDPLAEQFPGWNPYHYVHNNPINLIDPTGMAAKDPGVETHFVNEKGETIANTNDGSNDVVVIRRENVGAFVKDLSQKVSDKDDLNPDVNKALGNKYGYNITEHSKNVDGGKGENYKTDGSDDQQVQWNIGYNLGYDEKSLTTDPGSYQPGAFSRGAGHARGKNHKESGKMHAFEPKLSNNKAQNFIETNKAPKVNSRKYSDKPIPLLIEN